MAANKNSATAQKPAASMDAMKSLIVLDGDNDKDLSEDLALEEKRQRAGLVVKFQDGDEFTFRFLNWAGTARVYRHDDWDNNIHTVCLKTVGKPCEYCDQREAYERKGMKTTRMYLSQVLWVDFDRVSIFAQANNKASAVPDLDRVHQQMLKRNAGKPQSAPIDMSMCDFVIAQEGEKRERKFHTDRQPPEALSPEALEIIAKAGGIWDKETLVVKYITQDSPELVGLPPRGDGSKKASNNLSIDEDEEFALEWKPDGVE